MDSTPDLAKDIILRPWSGEGESEANHYVQGYPFVCVCIKVRASLNRVLKTRVQPLDSVLLI